jgi:hypothetical protein
VLLPRDNGYKPDYYQALNNWAIALEEQGKVSEAAEKWEQAQKLKRNE